MIEPAEAGSPERRAFLRVGGRAIAWHQLDLALSMDCERVICLAKGLDPDLINLQHHTESSGKLFHIVAGPKELAGLVSAHDELIVFAEGLLVEPRMALSQLEGGSAVLVQPIEAGLAAGFERIDLNHAAAGLLRVPGRLVEKLFELPPDCDVPSALTRVALQAGVGMREIPAAARTGVQWLMIRNETDAYSIESDWVAQKLGEDSSMSPGRWLARQGVTIFGSSLLHAGNARNFISLSAILAMVIALGLAWISSLVAGFVFCALAWSLYQASQVLQRIESPSAGDGAFLSLRSGAVGWLLDLELVLLLLWGSGFAGGASLAEALFTPIMLILLVRMIPQLSRSRWSDWLSDRALLSLVLAVTAAFGVVSAAVKLFSIGLAIIGIAVSRGDRG